MKTRRSVQGDISGQGNIPRVPPDVQEFSTRSSPWDDYSSRKPPRRSVGEVKLKGYHEIHVDLIGYRYPFLADYISPFQGQRICASWYVLEAIFQQSLDTATFSVFTVIIAHYPIFC